MQLSPNRARPSSCFPPRAQIRNAATPAGPAEHACLVSFFCKCQGTPLLPAFSQAGIINFVNMSLACASREESWRAWKAETRA